LNRYRRLLGVILFLAVLLAAAEFSGLREHFSLDYLHRQLVEHRGQGLLIFVLLFALGNLIQLPGWIFLAAAVLALGRTAGGIATYIAASCSCVVTYAVVRGIGSDALLAIRNRHAEALLRRLHQHPVRNVFLLRLLFQTLPAVNYALALSGIRFRAYLLGTLLGLPLPIAAYCLFFDYLSMLLHWVPVSTT